MRAARWFALMAAAQGGAAWYEHTLTLQPDGTAGIDTIVLSDQPNTNFGTNTGLFVGNSASSVRRTLIKFNLSGLPADARITSAVLSLFCISDDSSNARTFRVYRVKRAWVEDQATWNIFSTGNNWQTAGGFGADDCEQTAIGSRAFTGSETINQFKDFVLTPTTKDGLDLGNGWLVKADTESSDMYTFSSSDTVTAANRPKLVVQYESQTP